MKTYAWDSGFKYDVHHTGDGTLWVFAIYYKNELVGEGFSIESEEVAEKSANDFMRYYVTS